MTDIPIFVGSKTVKLDPKGRVVIPSKFRDALKDQCHQEVAVGQHMSQPCLELVADSNLIKLFEELETELKNTYQARKDAEKNKRTKEVRRLDEELHELNWSERFLRGYQCCKMDKLGRVLIPYDKRRLANLSEEIKIIPMKSSLELWDPDVYFEQSNKFLSNGPSPFMNRARFR